MKITLMCVAAAAAVGLFSTCTSDKPVSDFCKPGAQRCDQNKYEVCRDDGSAWALSQDCNAQSRMCIVSLGCRTCVPNSLVCGGQDGFDVVRCNREGTEFTKISRCDPDNGDLCVGGECVNACAHALELRSYEGCDYWAVDLDNAVVSNQGTAAAQQFSVVVSNPLELKATVTVEINEAPPGMPVKLKKVAEKQLSRIEGGGDLQVINLDPREVDCATDPRKNDGSGTCLSSHAYHIRSTAPIVAYQFNPLENVKVFSNDASLLIPTAGLGDRYLVMGWPQTLALTDNGLTNGGTNLRAFLTIVGTEEGTHVALKFGSAVVSVLGGGDIPPSKAGVEIQFMLGPYDVMNLETDGFGGDFTGSSILTDKPVAVFSGSEASDVPNFSDITKRMCCADHLEEQLLPESAFGTHFVAVKTPLRTKYVEEAGWDVALVPDEKEYWRILATTEETTVRTSLPPPYNVFLMQRGEFITFPSDRDFTVSADNAISFAQFTASQEASGIPPLASGGIDAPGGDPSFIMVPPVQQWRSKYVFLVPNKYEFDFLLLAAPTTATILLDDEPLAQRNERCEYANIGKLTVGTTEVEYQGIRCPLSAPKRNQPGNVALQDDGRHTLVSTDGQTFGLVVYGWDRYVSYGYPGGTNLQIINIQ
jgi:hypothetical protein